MAEKFLLRLEPELLAETRAAAKEREVSVSEMIRQCIRSGLLLHSAFPTPAQVRAHRASKEPQP